MSDQEPSSEVLGRQAGEEIGQHLGGLAGRAVGELLATGLAGVGVPTGSTGDAAADTPTDDRDGTDEQDVAEDESETTEERNESDESNENDESDAESGRPSSRAGLEAMSYRELQQLAKEVDVTANLAREEMEDRLVETLNLE